MKYLSIALCFFAFSSLVADIHFTSQPWTESFLETKASVFVENIRAEKKNVWQEILHISSSPYPEYQADVLFVGKSIETGKAVVRVEKLLLSDLEDEPFALSCLGEISKSRENRVKNPLFFEMAKNCLEGGIGVGKHLALRKESYTQIFSYLLGGIGTKSASWAQFEVGAQHVLYERHFLRLSYSHVHTFGKDASFLGFGTIRSQINNFSFKYQYHFLNGLDCIISITKRYTDRAPIHSAQIFSVGVSYPISW